MQNKSCWLSLLRHRRYVNGLVQEDRRGSFVTYRHYVLQSLRFPSNNETYFKRLNCSQRKLDGRGVFLLLIYAWLVSPVDIAWSLWRFRVDLWNEMGFHFTDAWPFFLSVFSCSCRGLGGTVRYLHGLDHGCWPGWFFTRYMWGLLCPGWFCACSASHIISLHCFARRALILWKRILHYVFFSLFRKKHFAFYFSF